MTAVLFLSKGLFKMSVKVNGKKLHLTTFEIATSGKNLRQCLVAQRDLAKVQEHYRNYHLKYENLKKGEDIEPEAIVDVLDARIKELDIYVGFLKPFLGLSDEQTKKVEDSDIDDVIDFTTEIIDKVTGVDSSKSEESESK